MKKYDFVGDARAIGLIGAIEFVTEPGTNKKPDPAVVQQNSAKNSGLRCYFKSLPGDSLGFCPPLIIEESQIHEMSIKYSVLAGIDFQTL